MEIQDIIGNKSHWPRKIRKLFWNNDIKHFERILMATFVFVNGLNPVVYEEWLTLIGVNEVKKRHILFLLNKFEENPDCYRLYAWNITNMRYEWLNGEVRHY